MDLQGRRFPHLHLPDGYSLVSWRPDLIEEHAETKYRSFRTEIDANVFPCLGNHQGCLNLMGEITRRENFIPSATWLVKYEDRELWNRSRHSRTEGNRSDTKSGYHTTPPQSMPRHLSFVSVIGRISRLRSEPGAPGSHRPQPGRHPVVRTTGLCKRKSRLQSGGGCLQLKTRKLVL